MITNKETNVKHMYTRVKNHVQGAHSFSVSVGIK